jgi:hypothetical protein
MLDAEPPAPQPPTPLLKRLLALVALLALLSSAAWSSWAILTDRADFSARAPERSAAPVPAGER